MTTKQQKLIKAIRDLAATDWEKYNQIEAFSDNELIEKFKTVTEFKKFCKLRNERESEICNY